MRQKEVALAKDRRQSWFAFGEQDGHMGIQEKVEAPGETIGHNTPSGWGGRCKATTNGEMTGIVGKAQ